MQRGNVLLAMGVAQILGILVYGPMDRLVRSRKKVVLAGTYLSAAVLLALALIARPSLWLAVALLIAVCFFCAYGTVIVAQGRTLFPDSLGGRGVTTVNMAQCLGLTVLPAVTGYIVEGFGAGDLAYRLDLPLVATNEAFFPARDDYEAHDALISIAEGAVIAADDRRRLSPDNYLKSQAEMAALFADIPEALDNTVEIARRCSYYPKTRNPILPRFAARDAADADAAVRAEAE